MYGNFIRNRQGVFHRLGVNLKIFSGFFFEKVTHLFPCAFLIMPPLVYFLLVTVVDALSFEVSSGTGKLVAYPCSCSEIKKGIKVKI